MSAATQDIDTPRYGAEDQAIPDLVQAFPGLIDSVTLSKPTLEDVFIHKTGHTFWNKENN